jgi:hypothetical protein
MREGSKAPQIGYTWLSPSAWVSCCRHFVQSNFIYALVFGSISPDLLHEDLTTEWWWLQLNPGPDGPIYRQGYHEGWPHPPLGDYNPITASLGKEGQKILITFVGW